MQVPQEINWPLEAARILVPGLITVIVGLWIARSNEKYKSDLLMQTHQFQLNHPKRVEAVTDISRELVKLRRIIRSLLAVLESSWSDNRSDMALFRKNVSELPESIRVIRVLRERNRLFFDPTVDGYMENVIIGTEKMSDLATANRDYVDLTLEIMLLGDESELSQYGKDVVKAIESLEAHFRDILK